MGKGRSKGYDRGKGKGKECNDVNSTAQDTAPPERITDAGVPFQLLPCEVNLLPSLKALGEAGSSQASEAAILEALRAHPFIEAKGKPGGGEKVDLGAPIGIVNEEHFKMNIRAFNQWLKTAEGRPFAREAGGPSDDGMYTLSAVLRRCMPRGLSRFTFSGVANEVVVRGFRKFTGLTADDEDEESGATNMSEDFYYTRDVEPSHFAVTTKSNGENGKISVRRIAGEDLLFAGSKNTCLVWRAEQDVGLLHPPVQGAPGPSIAAWAQRFWRGWGEDVRKAFVERVGTVGWTLMLEHNDAGHEHIFPIAKDFVEFVAILDHSGLPLPQKQAFAFFDEFHLPRVRCDEGLPMQVLPERLVAERAAVDREGAVLYLETQDGAAVGLLKVKSDFYVRARRTRQIFWNTLVDPLMRGESIDALDVPARKTGGGRRSVGVGWEAAEKRLQTGMKELQHVDGCSDHWQEWAQVAVGFAHWWRSKLEGSASEVERNQIIRDAKDKFGSTYRDYCRDAKLPGGEN